MRRLGKTYPFQVMRHKLYLPVLRLIDILGDVSRGVKTESVIELEELGVNSALGHRYETTSYKTLKKVLSFSKKIRDFDSVVDIGCGYGRALLVAKEVGYSNLYGVEISEKLVEVCEENLRRRSVSAQLVCCDARDWKLPDNDLIIFLFNPFGKEILADLIHKLVDNENRYLVIYANPKYSECFPSEPIYKFVNGHFGMFEERVNFYEL